MSSAKRIFLVGRASSLSSPAFTVAGVSDLFRVRGLLAVPVLSLWSMFELLEGRRANISGGGPVETFSPPLTGDAASGWFIKCSC